MTERNLSDIKNWNPYIQNDKNYNLSFHRYQQIQELEIKVKYLEDLTKTIFKFNCIITILAVIFTLFFFSTARIDNNVIRRIGIVSLCFGLVFFGVLLIACLTNFGIVQYIQHLTDSVYPCDYKLERSDSNTMPIFNKNKVIANCQSYCGDSDIEEQK